MSPTEFSKVLDTLGWDFVEVARRLDCNDRLVRRWAYGEADMPPGVARWLRTLVPFYERQSAALAAFHERHPAPTDWRVRK